MDCLVVQMLLVVIKFIEVFARAAFVVGTSYSLGLMSAGQFGIVTLLAGLFAFAFNWERHLDIQRRYVGSPPEVFDRAVNAALPFWLFNHVLMLPLFVLACALMAHLSPLQIAFAVTIVLGEHVGNQTYQMALVTKRYQRFLMLAAARNVVALSFAVPYILFAPSQLTLTYSLAVWAGAQTACMLVVAVQWLRTNVAAPHDATFSFSGRIWSQHRASLTHFTIGAVAILMLQYDRLVVAALLPLAEVGQYFRHVLIVSFAYQFFNVASYNRVIPRIFAAAPHRTKAELFIPIRRELLMVWSVVIVAFIAICLLDTATHHLISAKYHLSFLVALLLLVGALLRIVADFNGLILNAWLLERTILQRQVVSFVAGAALLVTLTYFLGITGAAAASAIGSAIYLISVAVAVHRLPERMPT